MKLKIDRVDPVQGMCKVAVIRPLGFLDSHRYQSQPQKKRLKKTSVSEDRSEEANERLGKHIDYTA